MHQISFMGHVMMGGKTHKKGGDYEHRRLMFYV